MKFFLLHIGQLFKCDPIYNMGNEIPLTLKTLNKLVTIKRDDFVNYVVCPSCHSIYEYEDCFIVKANGQKESKHCQHVQFPRHPIHHVDNHVGLYY